MFTSAVGADMTELERKLFEDRRLVQGVIHPLTADDISAGLDTWQPRGVVVSTVHTREL
jgi:hypothetical protein